MAFFCVAIDTRHVPLRHVRDFVRQHGRELGLVLREKDEAGVDADVAARQRESVDGGIRDGEELELLAVLGDRGDEAMPELVQVVVDLGILEVGAGGPDLAHDHFADLVLLPERDVGLRFLAEVRQCRSARGAMAADAAGRGALASGTTP